MVNLRQSGHPGGSHSKVHTVVATLLSGVMRYDLRHPEKRFGDRFIFAGGHVTPLLYATLAVFNEALRTKYEQTGDAKYLIPGGAERAVYGEDLATFRRHGGLSGHAEMEGKTLFHKFNSGPSGHALPAAAGEALALKRAGAGQVKVITFEGEGGFTTGVTHETQNSAWGLGLDNLYFVVDWNDYGIDDRPFSDVVYGTPGDLVRRPRLAHLRHRAGRRVRPGHPRPAGDAPEPQPGHGAHRHLGQDPQGPRLPDLQQQVPRRAARPVQRHLLADQEALRRQVRRDLRGLRQPAPRPPRSLHGPDPVQHPHGAGACCARPGPGGLPGRPPGGAGRLGAPGAEHLPPEHQGEPAQRRAALRRPELPGRPVRRARRQAGQPQRPGQVGRLGERLVPRQLQPAALPGRLRRPGRVHQHRRLRQGLRRLRRLRLVRAQQEPRGRAAAPGHHRVRHRRHAHRHGHGELRREARRRSSTASWAPAPPTAPLST